MEDSSQPGIEYVEDGEEEEVSTEQRRQSILEVDKPQKAGFGYKKTMNSSGRNFLSTWARRYFVLKDGFLLYYDYKSLADVPAYFDPKAKYVQHLLLS